MDCLINKDRAQLARESRGFFDKSFRLGETDLPTRLRIECVTGDVEERAAAVRKVYAQLEAGATLKVAGIVKAKS